MPHVGADLDALLDRIDCLRGDRQIMPLSGGLTNQNYLVTAPAGRFVVRVSSKDAELLSIDRRVEYENSRLAAAAGVGAPVVAYLPGDGVLVVGYLEGRTLQDTDFDEPEMIGRVAQACRRLHSGPRFVSDFDMMTIHRRYLRLVTERGFRIPPDYLDYQEAVGRIEDALAVRREPTVPCNNDLLAGNFIDNGSKIWIIDYEYAGNNDPCFELGNLASECHLSLDQLAELVSAYYGTLLRNKIARARLHGMMSNYGWTLWASIQDATSEIDFDFWAWGTAKYEAARAAFADSSFDELLTDVRRED